MLLHKLWYHTANIYPLISVFKSPIIHCVVIWVDLYSSHLTVSVSCWQPTCRKSWPTSSPSYWTARQRSKASTTLPNCPPTPPWSCANGSAASWPPSAGFPPKGDELEGTDGRRSLLTGPTRGTNPWTSLNPCLPYQSRGHLLLAVIPLLLLCCYRFYHYKYYFTFILSKHNGRWRRGQTVGGNRGDNKTVAMQQRMKARLILLQLRKKKMSLRVFHSLLLLLLLFDSSFPNRAPSPSCSTLLWVERITQLLCLQFGTVLPRFVLFF